MLVSICNKSVHRRSQSIKKRIRKTNTGIQTAKGPIYETTKTFVWSITIRGCMVPKRTINLSQNSQTETYLSTMI